MSRNSSVIGAIREVVATFGAARSASAAMLENHRPSAKALSQLGIDVEAFRSIGR